MAALGRLRTTDLPPASTLRRSFHLMSLRDCFDQGDDMKAHGPGLSREPGTKSSQGLPGSSCASAGIWDQQGGCRDKRAHRRYGLGVGGEQERRKHGFLPLHAPITHGTPGTDQLVWGSVLSPAMQGTDQNQEHRCTGSVNNTSTLVCAGVRACCTLLLTSFCGLLFA